MTGAGATPGFYELPEAEQVAALGRLARNALPAWGLDDAKVEPLAYRENMTFAVVAADGRRFALRVRQAGYRTPQQVQGELDFTEHLAGQGIPTPTVVRTLEGGSYATALHPTVPEPRLCDLAAWIEGRPLRLVAQPPQISVERARDAYLQVGELAARIYQAGQDWQRPAGFDRPVWDEAGIYRPGANLGDCRRAQAATPQQLSMMDALTERLDADLAAFGKAPDRYGLAQADLLPENLMLSPQGLRIIDFDDCGDSWVMFEFATAVWDLAGSEYFDPCVEALAEGFARVRPLGAEQLAMLPAFVVARVLSYIGHAASRPHLAQSAEAQPALLALMEGLGQAYLRR